MNAVEVEQNTPISSFLRCAIKEQPKFFVEAPVHFFINSRFYTTFMCTPQQFEELAFGHLVTRGYIGSKDACKEYMLQENKGVFSMHVCIASAQNNDFFWAEAGCVQEKLPLQKATPCMSNADGSATNMVEPALKKNERSSLFSLQQLENAAQTMVRRAELYQRTGGVHSAALGYGAELFCCEDIGRSNALDKAVGCGVLQHMDLSRCFLIVTGRIALEMLIKTMVAQIPVLVSLNIPSDLAIKEAEEKGITLIGKMLKKKQHIYTHPQRINL